MPTNPTHSSSISFELMDMLTKINDNVNQVKERLSRLEALDHSEALKLLRDDVKSNREKITAQEIEIASLRTKIAPVIVLISIAGASVVDLVVSRIF